MMLYTANSPVSRKTIPKMLLLCLLLFSFIGCYSQPATVVYNSDTRIFNVPTGDGRPVMTDGIFQLGEWDDASKLIINDSTSILFKQFQGHLYLALDSRELLSPTIDLFLCTDSLNILQLHVSAQLGERNLLVAPEISEDTIWVWGQTTKWYANEFRWIYRLSDSLQRIEGLDWPEAIKQSGFPHEAVEMDILQSKLKGNSCLFRTDIWTAYTGENPISFPPETKIDNLDGWAKFELK
ncbi:MAG: hypothetical protein GY865_15335 [candidate division Zixibacteria bacterium]|nr:hypothetical protein [candidate division Zixibacteria bacterium]